MKNTILESKRDNLLLSYYEQIQQLGINVSFGQFKSMLLRTFASGGGMHNLSLRSNYYLAGVARYYFNGDLTNNKQVALTNPEAWKENSTISDDWNKDICKRLNALILILRNSYIDSIGTQMEQPEDFGTLPINKLLRKYGAKINKELGIVTTKKKKVPELDENPNVGNNYTFEIMYSQADCQKYERPTSPGSWCITYGQNHYNYYIKHLNIHYVIFRMNGWENVQRPSNPINEPGWSRQKPHDLYGNSLIALLQSNTSPEPVYITSRWNHGYGNLGCEADHAYTKEEFQQITGVTDDDLKRIYDIWKSHKGKTTNSSASETKRAFAEEIRKLKYIQMRINAGENPNDLLSVGKFIANGKKGVIQDSITVCRVKPEEGHNGDGYCFLVDKGKIVLETVARSNWVRTSTFSTFLLHLECHDNSSNKSVNYLYNIKKHQVLMVDGRYKFLSVPYSVDVSSSRYFTVNRSTTEFAVIDALTGEALKLPNGEYWANKIKKYSWEWRTSGKYGAKEIKNNACIDIVYDLSSGEHYLFHTGLNKFIESPIDTLKSKNILESDFKYTYSLGKMNNDNGTGIFSMYITDEWGHVVGELIYKDGEMIDCGLGIVLFGFIYLLGAGFAGVYVNDSIIVVDCEKNAPLMTPQNTYLSIASPNCTDAISRWDSYSKLITHVSGDDKNTCYLYILDKENRRLVKNPYGPVLQGDDYICIVSGSERLIFQTRQSLPNFLTKTGATLDIFINELVEKANGQVTKDDINQMVTESLMKILRKLNH